MRVLFGVLVLFFGMGIGPSASFAQPGWFWQNPLPQGNPLIAVSFLNSDTVTAVGTSGTILQSTDGGASWTRQRSGTTNHLNGVSFVDANTGTAVGSSGTILRTMAGE
jgi:photosystem II stability/assembly factor-like uncharacterized protein